MQCAVWYIVKNLQYHIKKAGRVVVLIELASSASNYDICVVYGEQYRTHIVHNTVFSIVFRALYRRQRGWYS